MNVRDSEVICGLLTTIPACRPGRDYRLTTNPDEADIVIFNTCSVRQHAEDKVWSEIGRFAKLKQGKGQSPGGTVKKVKNLGDSPQKAGTVPIIGVIGCMAQNYAEEIFKRAPRVDFVVGPSDIHKIPAIINKLSLARPALYAAKIWETDSQIRPEEIYHTGFYQDKEHAFIVISEGCSNFCSYCLVPYVRGPLHNRNHRDILKEIQEAVDKGITQFTLLGQNVNAYQYEGVNFVRLVRLVNLVKGLKGFSFITSHPKDTSIDLFKAIVDCDKLKKYLHLPVQAGSDRILELMNRGYTRKFYLDLAQNYRKIVKGGLLTTDIIVGFTTEAEKDFRETFDLVNNMEFDSAYIFKYSPRPHTEAQKLKDDVTKEEKERRHKVILELQKGISKKKGIKFK